jgi:hypothetical protein
MLGGSGGLVDAAPMLGWIAALGLLLLGGTARAQPSEYEVKAAFLFNFAKFVDWPEGSFTAPEQGLRLCVLGSDPFGQTLDQVVSGKEVNGRPVEVRRVQAPAVPPHCHILFLSGSEDERLGQHLRHLRHVSVLTVSDVDGFAERGGVIGMRMDQNKVRFEVNMIAARDAKLKLSSQLLKVATQLFGHLDGEP